MALIASFGCVSGVLFAEKIEGVTDSESKMLLEKVQRLITENHDLQARVRWETPGDIGTLCSLLFSMSFLSLFLPYKEGLD